MKQRTHPASRAVECACEPLERRALLTIPHGVLDFLVDTHTITAVFTDQPLGQGNPVNVSPSLVKEDLFVERNVGTETFVPWSQISFNYTGSNPATFNFSGFPVPPSPRSDILPEGNYRASISRDEVFNGTDRMFADANHDFWVFAGDISGPGGVRDRNVNLSDFNQLAANFGRTPATYTQGDINYDGTVNLQDFNILAGRFGARIDAAPSSPDEITAGMQTSSTITLSWLDSVDGETGYRVQQSTDGQNFTVNYPAPAGSGGTQEFVVPNLEDGSRYWFRVRAYVPDPATNLIASALTTSSYSDTNVSPDTEYHYEVTAVTGAAMDGSAVQSYPAGPATQTTSPRGAPADLRAEVIDENNHQLTWKDKAAFESAYAVERFNGTGWDNISGSLPDERTHFLVQNLFSETDYTFRVAVTVPGEIKYSQPVTATTTAFGEKLELAIVILGHKQRLNRLPPVPPNDPKAAGLTNVAFRLRNEKNVRVLRVSEVKHDQPQVNWDGSGPAFDWAVDQVQGNNGIMRVAVIGYSHGAHIAKRFAERLRPQLNFLQSISYTAYVDANERRDANDYHLPAFAITAEPNIPGNWHDNFFNIRPWGFGNWLKGKPVVGAELNQPVDATHVGIDDTSLVQNRIVTQTAGRLGLP